MKEFATLPPPHSRLYQIHRRWRLFHSQSKQSLERHLTQHATNEEGCSQFPPISLNATTVVEQTAKPIAHGTSEWDAFGLESLETNELVMNDAAFAIVGELVEEVDLPDAKAKVAILGLSDILIPGGLDDAQPAHILCQHGLNRLMATPTSGITTSIAVFEQGHPRENLGFNSGASWSARDWANGA